MNYQIINHVIFFQIFENGRWTQGAVVMEMAGAAAGIVGIVGIVGAIGARSPE